MADDVLSIRHWLYSLTNIGAEELPKPKDFKRPAWFVEEPMRVPDPRRPDAYRERVTLNAVFLAKDVGQRKDIVQRVRQDLADRRWILPLYDTNRQQVGYIRECRLTFSKPDGLDQSMELKYLVYIPYTPIEYDPLEVIHNRYDPTLKKGGKPSGT